MQNEFIFERIARLSLFIIYFWFGILKALGMSPAADLVRQLHAQTIPFINFDTFYVVFALIEVGIGILFLFPKYTKPAVLFLGVHMLTTALPLILLPSIAWQAWLTPTLEGQYIIKNLALAACAIGIYQARAYKKTT